MEISKDEVLERLEDVYDPELGISIVDLGLVQEIKIGDTISIEVVPTTPACPLIYEIEDNIVKMFPEYSVEVIWNTEKAWSPYFVTAIGRDMLGALGVSLNT